MLNNLLRGIEPICSVLIQDSLESSGSSVLHAVIQANSTRPTLSNNSVHVICFEHPPTRMKKLLLLDDSASRIEFHDHCANHRGWAEDSTVSEFSNFSSVIVDQKSKNFLFIDSLSMLISRIGFNETYRQLHKLIQADIQLVCLVHEDFIPHHSTSLTKLRHIFSTCLKVTPSVYSSENLVIISTHIKKGGKVVRGIEECSVDSANEVIFHEVIDAKKKEIGKPIKVNIIPKELTTFKLDLGDNEKVARDKLVLPYLLPEGGGGKVIYELEDADDWDEEDPDDDLDV